MPVTAQSGGGERRRSFGSKRSSHWRPDTEAKVAKPLQRRAHDWKEIRASVARPGRLVFGLSYGPNADPTQRVVPTNHIDGSTAGLPATTSAHRLFQVIPHDLGTAKSCNSSPYLILSSLTWATGSTVFQSEHQPSKPSLLGSRRRQIPHRLMMKGWPMQPSAIRGRPSRCRGPALLSTSSMR